MILILFCGHELVFHAHIIAILWPQLHFFFFLLLGAPHISTHLTSAPTCQSDTPTSLPDSPHLDFQLQLIYDQPVRRLGWLARSFSAWLSRLPRLVCIFACVLQVSWLPVSTSAKLQEDPAKTLSAIPCSARRVCSEVSIHSAGFPASGLFPVFPACWFRELRLSTNCSRRVLQLGPNLACYTAVVQGSVLSASTTGQLELRVAASFRGN